MPSLDEIGPIILEKNFFFVHVFLLFRNYFPLEKGGGATFEQTPKDAEIGQVALARKIFKNFVNAFSLFCYYLPLENIKAFQLNKLEGCLYQVWFEFALWLWNKFFIHFVNEFPLFRYYFPLEKDGALHLNNLEFPLPKDALCQVWLKLAQ